MVDIDETRLLYPPLQLGARLRFHPKSLQAFNDLGRPLVQWTARFELSTTGGVESHVEILEFHPTSRFGESRREAPISNGQTRKLTVWRVYFFLLERLAHQLRPVFDGAGKIASMNKVKFRRVHPLILYIVHFEPYVGWYPVQDESINRQLNPAA